MAIDLEQTTSAIIADMVWTCLGCGDVLPPNRGGHCDACVQWGPEEDPIENDPPAEENEDPIYRHLVRHPAMCETCGRAFLTSGAAQCAACLLARAEAKRILETPEIAAARAHIRETLAGWGIEAQESGVPF